MGELRLGELRFAGDDLRLLGDVPRFGEDRFGERLDFLSFFLPRSVLLCRFRGASSLRAPFPFRFFPAAGDELRFLSPADDELRLLSAAGDELRLAGDPGWEEAAGDAGAGDFASDASAAEAAAGEAGADAATFCSGEPAALCEEAALAAGELVRARHSPASASL